MDAIAENTGKPIYDAGVLNSADKVNTYCSHDAFEDPDNCSQYLKDSFRQQVKTECEGKNTCHITKLNQYINIPTAVKDSTCFAPTSQIFIQVGCSLLEEEWNSRAEKGLLLACIAVFIALFVSNYLDYVKKIQANDYVEWDVNTITAGDYSIEFDLDAGFYETYLETVMEDWVKKSAEEGRIYLSKAVGF